MGMTLEEAIKYYSELAEENEKDAEQFKRIKATEDIASYCYECAKEHRQLAKWLRELKAYEEIIYELTEVMQWYDGCEESQGFREYPTNDFIDDVRKCVEQFEEVNADE